MPSSDAKFTLAFLASNTLTELIFPSITAIKSALKPPNAPLSISAFFSSNALMTSVCPVTAATISGVIPLSAARLIVAPLSSNALTI